MSKRRSSVTREFENPTRDQNPGRGRGVLATLVVLSLLGLVFWLLVGKQES